MNRTAPFLAFLQLSRQSISLSSKTLIRHGAAISVAARQQAYHGSSLNTPTLYGPLSSQHGLVKSPYTSIRWLSSAPLEDDLNVFYPGLVKRIESGDIQLIDVREPEELTQWGQITNSFNIPLGQVEEAFTLDEADFKIRYGRPKPSKGDNNVVFHCRAGVRSLEALQTARSKGYLMARHFPGGWLEWAKENNLPGE